MGMKLEIYGFTWLLQSCGWMGAGINWDEAASIVGTVHIAH